MSWRLPCPAGKAEERTEVGRRQAARAGVARRRRSKGELVVEWGGILSANPRGVILRVYLGIWLPGPTSSVPKVPDVFPPSTTQQQGPRSLENKFNL